jgi:ubiquinone/menaquinone biosynthesis C-methylase UbiE
MRVLDLGCGSGSDLGFWKVTPEDNVIGADINKAVLATARLRSPYRIYICAAGESLPFRDQYFDRVISSVAMPYMNIPHALKEIRRVLRVNGRLSCSLHSPSFTRSELYSHALPHLKATLFRLYVMANGAVFHLTGRTMSIAGKSESCQTERGMSLALRRAGFLGFSFDRIQSTTGERFLVEAVRP